MNELNAADSHTGKLFSVMWISQWFPDYETRNATASALTPDISRKLYVLTHWGSLPSCQAALCAPMSHCALLEGKRCAGLTAESHGVRAKSGALLWPVPSSKMLTEFGKLELRSKLEFSWQICSRSHRAPPSCCLGIHVYPHAHAHICTHTCMHRCALTVWRTP